MINQPNKDRATTPPHRGKIITKEHYEHLRTKKFTGVKLLYGQNHKSPISYSNPPNADVDLSDELIKDIPKWFWDSLILFYPLFEKDNLVIILKDGGIQIHCKL